MEGGASLLLPPGLVKKPAGPLGWARAADGGTSSISDGSALGFPVLLLVFISQQLRTGTVRRTKIKIVVLPSLPPSREHLWTHPGLGLCVWPLRYQLLSLPWCL